MVIKQFVIVMYCTKKQCFLYMYMSRINLIIPTRTLNFYIEVHWVIWRLHNSVGWSGVDIVQYGCLKFTLFSTVVWSSHYSVGLSEIHIVQWDDQEIK